MVHASRAPAAELSAGVKLSSFTNKSYWFRWGDVKHLTPRQLQTAIGDLAASGQGELSAFAFKIVSPSNAGTFKPGGLAKGYFQEYIATKAVTPDAVGIAQPTR